MSWCGWEKDIYICAPPNRVTLPQKLINDVRADKARGTSDLIIGPVRSLSLKFEAKSSSETYEDKRHDDDGEYGVRELVGCFCHTYIHTDISSWLEMMGSSQAKYKPDLSGTVWCCGDLAALINNQDSPQRDQIRLSYWWFGLTEGVGSATAREDSECQ